MSARDPKGWTISEALVGYTAEHDAAEAEYIEGCWVSNGLSCWGHTRAIVLKAIAEIEAEHPYFVGRDA